MRQHVFEIWTTLLCWPSWKAAYNVLAGCMHKLFYISSDFHCIECFRDALSFSELHHKIPCVYLISAEKWIATKHLMKSYHSPHHESLLASHIDETELIAIQKRPTLCIERHMHAQVHMVASSRGTPLFSALHGHNLTKNMRRETP